jgi:hypothetical protein
MPRARHFLVLFFLLQLLGCDMLGIDTPAKKRALTEADGMAVGAACRHAGRAIEDCYVLNPTANRAAVFGGWKDMNDYMTKNKIEVVKPEALNTGSTTTANKTPGAGLAPSAVFEPPAKTGNTAQFVPPDNLKKAVPAEKKPSNKAAPSPALPAPKLPSSSPDSPTSTPKLPSSSPNLPSSAQPEPQKSATKDGRVIAKVDNETVMRAKEQAHTPTSKAH